MAVEIERKFLVRSDAWRAGVTASRRYVQGYLNGGGNDACSVRVRIGAASAWLSVKAAVAGVSRSEFEYAIPAADAEQMLAQFCPRVVEKVRHLFPWHGLTFEVDEFAGDNAGLVVAEIELPCADAAFARPDWLGREVSAVPRYYNVRLLDHPYSQWSAAERTEL